VAAAVKAQLGIEAELVVGGRGMFLVEIDGRTVFERRLGVKIPEPEAFVALVAEQGRGYWPPGVP
jgi:hypothetical protein